MSDLDTIRSRTCNSLQCRNCSDWLKIEYTSLFEEVIDGVNVRIDELPMLVCPACSHTYFTLRTLLMLSQLVENAHEKNNHEIILTKKNFSQTKFQYCQKIDFNYDPTDYYHIPGLVRREMNGALTPVFFKKKILQHFRSDPDYSVDQVSDTYGTIYHGDQWYISYGITRGGKVICWLYDLDQLPEDEQQHFKAFNTASDHDIASEFYAAQIGAEITPPTAVYEIFSQLNSINQATMKKFNVELFKTPNPDRQESASRPIFWDKDNVLPVVNSLHQVCIESIRPHVLKPEIKKKDNKFVFAKLGGLKLLDKWIQLYCPNLDSSSIMKPLFVLDDFRKIVDHDTGSDEERILEYCYERMAVSKKNFENLYDSVVKGISNSFDEITKSLCR